MHAGVVDDALVMWLNAGSRRWQVMQRVVGGLAGRLAGVEVGLMVLLALAGRRRTALEMLGAVGAIYVASDVLGQICPRQRPFERLTDVTSLTAHAAGRSFPSRHVASGLAMAWIGGRAHPRLGWVMAVVAWGLGVTRVAAGLHYPSDVLAGAGLGWLVAHGAQRLPGVTYSNRRHVTRTG